MIREYSTTNSCEKTGKLTAHYMEVNKSITMYMEKVQMYRQERDEYNFKLLCVWMNGEEKDGWVEIATWGFT